MIQQENNNKCDACGQKIGSSIYKIQLVGKYLKVKLGLPKLRAKFPVKLHPRIKKVEGMLAELSKEMNDFETYTKQLWSLVDKFIQEKGGTEKNILDLSFCESCHQEWRLQADELEQTFKNKYSEAEQKEVERKFKEIDEESDQLFSEFVAEVGRERTEQIDEETNEEIKNEFLAERERERQKCPTTETRNSPAYHSY